MVAKIAAARAEEFFEEEVGEAARVMRMTACSSRGYPG